MSSNDERLSSEGESTTSFDDDICLASIQQLKFQVNSKRLVPSGGTKVKVTREERWSLEPQEPTPAENNVEENVISNSDTESDLDYDDSDRDPDYVPEKKKKHTEEDIMWLPQPVDQQVDQPAERPVVQPAREIVEQHDASNDSARIEPSEQLPEEGRGRKKRRLTPEERRVRDEVERNKKMASKQSIKNGCSDTCKLKCKERFTRERRVAINTQFWSLQGSHRRAFVLQRVRKSSVKRRRANPATSRRSYTLTYELPNEQGENIPVCRKMFVDTLDIGDKAIKNTLETESLDDKRGKHVPAHAIDHDEIKADIERYHPCIHHYRREHAPLRRYLPSDVSITDMHKTFIATRESPISYPLYYKVFKEMNISMAHLGNEECEECKAHSIHKTKENCSAPCDICERQEQHKTRAKQARSEYQADAGRPTSPNECIVSADMQKVIMLPRMEMFKSVLFTRRICLFNETFAAVGSKKNKNTPKNNLACLWHEGIRGRNDEDIASTFWQFLNENRDFPSMTIWLDNCAGQNKNWTLFTVMATAVNSVDIFNISKITLKYFEKGHTFMSADSAHAEIEEQLKKTKQVMDFRDFVQCVEKTSCKALAMSKTAFRQWVSGTSQYKLRQSDDRPILANISVAEFRRGCRELYYKNSHASDFVSFSFIKKDFVIQEKPSYKEARGVPKPKKDDILKKLLPLMPETRHAFWQELFVSSVPDLINTFE